ncbi:MAG: hypothetical protein L0Y73_05230 [Candidatus Aminicenantes bacterium]|nr:hypothetical protein [Candidatus Aminicenantes bacterium]
MKKKTLTYLLLLASVAIFVFGLVSLFAAPMSMCEKPFNEATCNDEFAGSCTQAGGCWGNSSIVATNCSITCNSYTVNAQGQCVRELPAAYVNCGTWIY